MKETQKIKEQKVYAEMKRWGPKAAQRILDGIKEFGVVFHTYSNGNAG